MSDTADGLKRLVLITHEFRVIITVEHDEWSRGAVQSEIVSHLDSVPGFLAYRVVPIPPKDDTEVIP